MNTNSMRFTAANALGDVIGRALSAKGDYGIESIRALGFENIEKLLMSDPVHRMLMEHRAAAATPLPERSQLILDKAVVKVGLQRLSFVADLLAEGLTFPLADPLSVTEVEWNRQNRVGAAQRTMSPSARGEDKQPLLLPGRVPVYLTTDYFSIDIRTLRQSQRVGMPLDTSNVESCTRAVNEALEDAAINGATTLDGQELAVSGYTAPGVLNAPNAQSQALSVDWTGANTPGTTGPAIVTDVMAMVNKAQTAKKYGPYNLYIGTKAGNLFEQDYKSTAGGDKTIRERVEAIQAGGRGIRVRVTDMFPGASTGNQCALVQMTSDVVDLITGQSPTVIPWTSLDGFTFHNLVMAIMIPRFRSDYDGNSGVVIGTKS